MTDKPTPTDEELKAMWQLHAADIGGIFYYARAVLAKWGQPAQVTKGRKVFVCTHCDGVYADQPVTQCDCMPDENTFTEGWICFDAPAQAAEPVARLVIGKTKGGVSLTHIAEPAAFQLPEGMYALYTAPQPVARDPLTDEQVNAVARSVLEKPVIDGAAPAWSLAVGIARAIEQAHGIKGGQHVE